MYIHKSRALLNALVLYGFFVVVSAYTTIADESFDWQSDWALEDYFTISMDSEGYELPTSIAFIPNSGNDPKDPLYFVTELSGRLKVVTNDRSTYTFAEDFFKLKTEKEPGKTIVQLGLAGICLDPKNGYVFVTFPYQDSNDILRNNIVRFKSKPGIFSLKPESSTEFTQIFLDDESGISHQIGPCQVHDDLLYVGVGDGNNPAHSQSLNSTLGKILRMTLDGKPYPANPYYIDEDITNPRNFVWAYGLRNPFGLKIVEDRVFVSDNGVTSDRFLEVHEGENYLWDKTNWSIGTNTDLVFAPAVCPVQLDFYSDNLDFFPEEYRGKFYLALGGSEDVAGPGTRGDKSVVMLDFGFEKNKMLSVPEHFLKFRGDGKQMIPGLGIGPDGLYIVPLLPNKNGQTAVLKVQYDPSNSYPYKMRHESGSKYLFMSKGCLACHTLYGKNFGTMFGQKMVEVGPNLDRDPLVKRLDKRLNSPEYLEKVSSVDSLDFEPYESYRDARQEVLNLGGDEKIRAWIKYHLMEPKFDNPKAQMPNLGLSEKEAVILTDMLMKKESTKNKYFYLLSSYIPEIRYRYLIYAFVIGAILSFIFFLALYILFLRKR